MRYVLPLAAVVVVAACAQLGAPRELAYDRLSERDVGLAAATLQNTLETGDNNITVVWQNTVNGHAGATTPVRTFVTDSGIFCRDYIEVLVIDEAVERFDNTACRGDAGSWVWVR